jgi:hypothetical protein
MCRTAILVAQVADLQTRLADATLAMFEKYAGSLFTTARGRDERRFQATKRDAVGGHVHRALLRHDAGQRDIRAHPDEIQTVEAFAHKHFLTVKSSHAGLRHVVVEGTAAQFSNAFGAALCS